jgi:hypothetical protein
MSTPDINIRPTMPTDILELRAAEQRRRLHNTVVDLRQELREKLDSKKVAREYLAPAASVAGVLGLLFGYAIASVFI